MDSELKINRVKAAPRRQRIFKVDPKVLPHAFLTGNVVEILEGIPKDAEFRGYTIDPMTNTLQIFVEHPSFAVVEEGCYAPTFDIRVRSVDGRALKVFRRIADAETTLESP